MSGGERSAHSLPSQVGGAERVIARAEWYGLCPSAARRGWLGRRLAAKHAIAGRGEAANQPARLDRVVHPGGRPAVGHAGLDGLLRYFAALPIEKRQLSAALRPSPLEIAPLRLARP